MERLFKLYTQDPSIVADVSDRTLKTIEKALFRKRLKGQRAQFRDDVRNEIANREYQIRVVKKADELENALRVFFCAKEVLWKNIRDGSPGLATKKLKMYGRMIGLAVNDMSNIPTNIWTIDALTNQVRGKGSLNTDEHFYSLYANAGPDMIFEALAKDIKFDIVYKYNQTVKATVAENNQLGVHHRKHKMIDPEISYDLARVSQLVMFEQKPTLIKLAWHELFRRWERDPEIKVPFSNVISLEEAAIIRPELEKLLPEQNSINTPVTVEVTLEEK